jgi:hypothetical protein
MVGIGADLIKQDATRPDLPFGRSAELRLDGRLSLYLSLLRAKPPRAMLGELDHYGYVRYLSCHRYTSLVDADRLPTTALSSPSWTRTMDCP